MKLLDTKITVKIPKICSAVYDVQIGTGIIKSSGAMIGKTGAYTRATVISNADVWGLVGDKVDASLGKAGIAFDLVEVPEGETFKTYETAQALYEALAEFRASRGDPIIAVGGGVIGDLAGFVAATYMRGVPFVNIPTTLLAQVDSSIGGKTGVDLSEGKNLVGAFYQPALVISDTEVLHSLPDREVRCGLAEVIKTALLTGDGFLDYVDENMEDLVRLSEIALSETVRRCVKFKAAIVADDEHDLTGRRAILNYGHTYAHALEAVAGYRDLPHGEAVAAGLAFAARLSVKIGLGQEAVVAKTDQLLARAGLSNSVAGAKDKDILTVMGRDKKRQGQGITFVLLEDFGKPVLKTVDEKTVLNFIKELP